MTNQDVPVCRGCLVELDSNDSHSLKLSSVLDLFQKCTNLTASLDDKDLPQSICNQCYTKCAQWRVFRTMCHEVDQLLRVNEPPPPPTVVVVKSQAPALSSYLEFEDFDDVDDPLEAPDDTESDTDPDHEPASKIPSSNKQQPQRRTRANRSHSYKEELLDDDYEVFDVDVPEDAQYVQSDESEGNSEDEPLTKRQKTLEELEGLQLKSMTAYHRVYQNWENWRATIGIDTSVPPTEDELLKYFNSLAETNEKSPSSFITIRSMLRKMILKRFNIDINRWEELSSLLKDFLVGYEPKKLKMFTLSQVNEFLNEASDEHYLLHKAIIIIAMKIGATVVQLHDMTPEEVFHNPEKGKLYVFTKQGASGLKKEKISNTEECKYADILLRYMTQPGMDPRREKFFIGLHKNRWVNLGRNRMPTIIKEVADFLNLPDSSSYRYCSIRKSCSNSRRRRDALLDN